MKIVLVNKFYYPRGGDCVYTINLESLLKSQGHEVAVFAMDYSENIASQYKDYFPSEISFSISNNSNLFESFIRPFGTSEVKTKFKALLNDFQPDVVHLNNIHTQLSPIVAELAQKYGSKVVWTLHDYKLLCTRYDCLRNDTQVCELCFQNKTNVLKYKCMKNSLVASVIAYLEAVKWNKDTLNKYVDTYICPSVFMKNKMLQGDFPADKLNHLSNFVELSKFDSTVSVKEDYYCYIGRLSHEKGVRTLLKAASDLPYKLIVIGGGPLADECQKYASEKIEFVGYKNWTEIKTIVGKARFIVTPSEWYENNPLSVIESLCLGTPVVGANIGGIPELITEPETGLLFSSKDVEVLKEKIQKAWKIYNDDFDFESILKSSQNKFSCELYYDELIKIYKN